MKIELLSTRYQVSSLLEKDVSDVLSLCEGNPMFYRHCPPAASKESIISYMYALPPNKTPEDKYFIGFYRDKELIAVMDLIHKFPKEDTAWIGLFMMKKDLQAKGIATTIISECCEYLKALSLKEIGLGYAKGNPQCESFWTKNNFVKTGVETPADGYTVVVMRRIL